MPPSSAAVDVPTVTIEKFEGPSAFYELLCENMPFLRFSYMKYATKQEKVVVLLDLPGGSGNYDWEFNALGDAIVITVNWSKSLYDVTDLYKSALREKEITMDHPKLHALQTEIMKQGYSTKNVPQSRIHVDLGRRVHKDDGTWDIDVIKHDGNKILQFEFSCFQEEVLKKVKRGTFE